MSRTSTSHEPWPREGYFYAPDPSSQQVCTIGGNLAENSGGAHCLKNGFTVNHVTGARVVLPDGALLTLGGKAMDAGDGPDLLGVIVGSEGTLGIAVEVTLRIVRQPEVVVTQLAAFATVDAAGDAVSRIVAAGILPAAMEIMDRFTIQAAEEAYRPGYPDGAGSVLLVELDGVAAQTELDAAAVEALCLAAGAFEIRTASDAAERALLWMGRKGAFAAMGRVSPDYYVQDGVVPRTKLPAVLRRIDELSEEHGLRVGNVFHAGDGNLHPLVLYDASVDGDYERAKTLADAILAACVDEGGSLTGEHGIGVDKACAMPSMFSERDLEVFERVRRAFDPDGLANPGKVIPTPRLCGEVPGPYRTHPLEKLGVAERFSAAPPARRRSRRRPSTWRRRAPRDGRSASATTSRRRGSTASSSTRRATSRAPSRRASGFRRCARHSRPPASGSPSIRPATPRSARASQDGSPGRCRTGSGRPATSSSA